MTQTADPRRAFDLFVNKKARMRVGRALGRTLYLDDPDADDPMDDLCVGIMDTPELAAAIVWLWNMYRDRDDQVMNCVQTGERGTPQESHPPRAGGK